MYRLDDDQRRQDRRVHGRVPEAAIVATRSPRRSSALEPADARLGDRPGRLRRQPPGEQGGRRPRASARRSRCKGPVDHDVPVLRVAGPTGRLEAIVFGYACHCTVLELLQVLRRLRRLRPARDLEARYPGAQAMFVAGCGADQNPLPRRTVELAEAYGRRARRGRRRVVVGRRCGRSSGRSRPPYEEIDLAFATLPTREQIEADAKSKDLSVANRAEVLLADDRDRGGSSPRPIPTRSQVWRLGDLTWVFLGGEVVVDYSLRLKRNLGVVAHLGLGLLQRRDGVYPLAPRPQGRGLRGGDGDDLLRPAVVVGRGRRGPDHSTRPSNRARLNAGSKRLGTVTVSRPRPAAGKSSSRGFERADAAASRRRRGRSTNASRKAKTAAGWTPWRARPRPAARAGRDRRRRARRPGEQPGRVVTRPGAGPAACATGRSRPRARRRPGRRRPPTRPKTSQQSGRPARSRPAARPAPRRGPSSRVRLRPRPDRVRAGAERRNAA